MLGMLFGPVFLFAMLSITPTVAGKPPLYAQVILCVMFPLNVVWLLVLQPSGGLVVQFALSAVTYAGVFHVAHRVYRRRHPLPPANACTNCHYDLTGNESGTCPECGTAIAPPSKTEVAG